MPDIIKTWTKIEYNVGDSPYDMKKLGNIDNKVREWLEDNIKKQYAHMIMMTYTETEFPVGLDQVIIMPAVYFEDETDAAGFKLQFS